MKNHPAKTRFTSDKSFRTLFTIWLGCLLSTIIILTLAISDGSSLRSGLFYYCLVFIVSIICIAIRDKNYFWVFAGAMFLRLIFVICLQLFPPISPRDVKDWYVPMGTIYPDESFFILKARELGSSWQHFWNLNYSNQYERAAAYYALINLLFGKTYLWGRLINTLLGSLTAVIIYDTIVMTIGRHMRKIARLLVILAPVLILWSGIFIKECLLSFGIAVFVNGVSRLHFRSAFLQSCSAIIIGALVTAWLRPGMLILLLPIIFISHYNRAIKAPESRYFNLIFWGYALIICTLLFFPEQLISSLAEQSDMIKSTLESKQASVSFPFADVIMGQSGAVKVAGLCIMLSLSPVITVIWSQIPLIGNPSWYGGAIAAYALTWWFCFPFIFRSILDTCRQRHTWWVLWQATFIVWFIIAALARQGAGFDGFRYRDAMVPVIMLLTAKGIDATIVNQRSSKIWTAIFSTYGFAVIMVIVLRGADILRMR